MTSKTITRDDAEAALASCDWITCELYCTQRLDEDLGVGLESLKWLEAGVLPVASGGDKYAQSVMGNVHLHRYHSQQYPAEETLGIALKWWALATRQQGGEPMIEQVRYWYVEGKAQGLRLDEAERFLRQPEIGERYRRYGGRDIL